MTPKKTTKSNKKTIKNVPNKVTHVFFCIDRSGSMNGLQKQVIEAVNEQIRTIKENADKGGETLVSYLQFDGAIDVLRDNVPASEINYITDKDYFPRGSTALFDAQGVAITKLEANAKHLDDEAFLVIVVSDGEENASTEWKYKLSGKIKELEATGKWTFSYMLANVKKDYAYQNFHASVGNVRNFASTIEGVVSSSYAMSGPLVNYMSAREQGVLRTANFYDDTNVVVSSNVNSAQSIDIANVNATVTPTQEDILKKLAGITPTKDIK